MNKLLKSVIHYYEVFCWEEDYICEAYDDYHSVSKIHIEYLNCGTHDIQS